VRFLDAITLFLAAACRAGSAAFLSAVDKMLKQTCLMVGLLVLGLALLLGAMGLMIAALFIGLTPYLGAHWAAMIAAGASLAGSGLFMAIALKVYKGLGRG
jgi:CHASE2 domain-containing sensor protein